MMQLNMNLVIIPLIAMIFTDHVDGWDCMITTGDCFRVSHQTYTWTHSNAQDCWQYYRGRLAIINTQEKHDFILSTGLLQTGMSRWLGLTRGWRPQWQWTDGTILSGWNKWDLLDSASGECAYYDGLMWRKDNCDTRTYKYLCEKPAGGDADPPIFVTLPRAVAITTEAKFPTTTQPDTTEIDTTTVYTTQSRRVTTDKMSTTLFKVDTTTGMDRTVKGRPISSTQYRLALTPSTVAFKSLDISNSSDQTSTTRSKGDSSDDNITSPETSNYSILPYSDSIRSSSQTPDISYNSSEIPKMLNMSLQGIISDGDLSIQPSVSSISANTTSSMNPKSTAASQNCEVSHWQMWTACSVRCGVSLFQTRWRFCSVSHWQGPFMHNFQYLPLQNTTLHLAIKFEHRECPVIQCPILWESWHNWGGCSASCGRGLRQRQRDSVCLAPQRCFTDDAQKEICYQHECPYVSVRVRVKLAISNMPVFTESDHRVSAKSVGLGGIVILLSILALMIISDTLLFFIRIYIFVKATVKKRKVALEERNQLANDLNR